MPAQETLSWDICTQSLDKVIEPLEYLAEWGRFHADSGYVYLGDKPPSLEDDGEWHLPRGGRWIDLKGSIATAFRGADIRRARRWLEFRIGERKAERFWRVLGALAKTVKRVEGTEHIELARQELAGTVDWLRCLKATIKKKSRKSGIAPEDRTIPLSLKRAAKLMGKGNSKDAAEWLRACIKDGIVPCESLSRQAHVFSREHFPAAVWPQISPK